MSSSSSPRRGIQTFDTSGWNLQRALAAKGNQTISICLPCHNEEATIGSLIAEMRKRLVEDTHFVDEIVVLDDRSSDGTVAAARDEGAAVISVDAALRQVGVAGLLPGRGKGNVLWSTLPASTGDLVIWCDADLTSFTADWIVHLAAPLLADPAIALVKAFYERPTDAAGQGGGRTTELAARPLLSMLYPDLAMLAQPLAGEVAARRSVLEQLTFVQGWGVEVAVLVDVLERWGASAIAQVDLGVRRHRHRPLEDLSVQAAEIALTLLLRSGKVSPTDLEHVLRRPDGRVVDLNVDTRPSVASLRRS
jgi:glucosyl-3-phosphoglycerate synthase